MDFPIEQLRPAVAGLADVWGRLGMTWSVSPTQPNYGKALVVAEFTSASWLAEIMIWVSGEAELGAVRLTDDRIVNKHYDLTGTADLDRLLGELTGLLTHDEIPADAVIARYIQR